MSTSNNKTSALVSQQLPEFVRNEYELFVKFLEYYYKFLEIDGQTLYLSKNFSRYLDIDEISSDVYEMEENEENDIAEYEPYHSMLDKLYRTYIHLLPESVIANKALIVKHAKDFYRSKGSEKSVQFLIRALYGKEASFYIPKTDILKASGGVWYSQKVLKIYDIQVGLLNSNGSLNVSTLEANTAALENFTSRPVRGTLSNASAVVESTNSFYQKNRLIYELAISSQVKEFENGERVYADFEENGQVKRVIANLYSGVITSVNIISPGLGYEEGTSVPLIPSDKGGQIVISKVSTGAIRYVSVQSQGSGFQLNDQLTFSGGGGRNAAAYVSQVDSSGLIHPNSYNIVASTIDLVANISIGNTYSNLSNSNANTTIANAVTYWVYSNAGPVSVCTVSFGGFDYSSAPRVNVVANTIIKTLGVLGRMKIMNGGQGYAANDFIKIDNIQGSYGDGAAGRVASVDANGKITRVEFVQVPGFLVGGEGYNMNYLPRANVVSNTGSNASIVVTEILGTGDQLVSNSDVIGAIQELTIVDGGTDYIVPPTLDFSQIRVGSGANANVTIAAGVFEYPGEFVTNDGQVSSHSFIQDRDYYQNYSYVVRAPVPFNKYRKYINDLTHPVGTKIFADYLFEIPEVIQTNVFNTQTTKVYKLVESNYLVNGYKSATFRSTQNTANYIPYVAKGYYNVNTSYVSATYEANNNLIYISNENNTFETGKNVYIKFEDYSHNGLNDAINVFMVTSNTMYTILGSNDSGFYVSTSNSSNMVPQITGNIRVYDPTMVLHVFNHGLPLGEKVQLEFGNFGTDNSLANGEFEDGVRKTNRYTLRKVGSQYFNIEHPNIAYIVEESGPVNVYTRFVTVQQQNHNKTAGDVTLFRFTSGDIANTTNAYYVVRSVHGANTYNVRTPNFLYSNGQVNVYSNVVTINETSHGHTNNSYVYVGFNNVTPTIVENDNVAHLYDRSGIYKITVVNSNQFLISTGYPVDTISYTNTSSYNVRVYPTNTALTSAKIARRNHGLSNGNKVMINFNSANISNTIYTISNIIDSNTYNITGLNIYMTKDTQMVGNARVGLYQ